MKTLVVLLVPDAHARNVLWAGVPAGTVGVELEMTDQDLSMQEAQFTEQVLRPMISRLRQEEAWLLG